MNTHRSASSGTSWNRQPTQEPSTAWCPCPDGIEANVDPLNSVNSVDNLKSVIQAVPSPLTSTFDYSFYGMSEEREIKLIYTPQRGHHERHAENALSNRSSDVKKMGEHWKDDLQYRKPWAMPSTLKTCFQLIVSHKYR